MADPSVKKARIAFLKEKMSRLGVANAGPRVVVKSISLSFTMAQILRAWQKDI